ncbi:MAG: superoxide dismutase [Candidatus Woesearchaeota archaeon]
MTYKSKEFNSLLGIKGFSEGLLQNHFRLYQGYVANTNKLSEILSTLSKEGKQGTPEYAELKRRFGWEFNGMRLHELYFENMSKTSKKPKNSVLLKEIEEEFGSFEEWEKDFKAVGALRGIGWVVLFYDPIGEKLFNAWINEHDLGHLTGATPLLVLDVFEHAFMLDYGLNRKDYIDKFFDIINWQIVEKRFKK